MVVKTSSVWDYKIVLLYWNFYRMWQRRKIVCGLNGYMNTVYEGTNCWSCQIPIAATRVPKKILKSRKYVIGALTLLQGELKTRLRSKVINGKLSINKMHLSILNYQKGTWKGMTLQPVIHPRYKFTLYG